DEAHADDRVVHRRVLAPARTDTPGGVEQPVPGDGRNGLPFLAHRPASSMPASESSSSASRCAWFGLRLPGLSSGCRLIQAASAPGWFSSVPAPSVARAATPARLGATPLPRTPGSML